MGMANGLGLNDEISFGKYKGKMVESVYKDNVGYLVWLRDAKGDNRNYFAQEVHVLLDDAIVSDKNLAKKFKPWNKTVSNFDAHGDAVGTVRDKVKPETREVAYAESWGAF